MDIWEIGDRYVTDLHRESKPVLGRGDLIAQRVIELKLRVVPSPAPHPKHANIVDWPVEKHKRLKIATKLAREGAILVIRQASIETAG